VSARSRPIRVAAELVGLVIGVLGWVPAPASAASPSYKLVHACTYDNPPYCQPSNATAPERGPPVGGVHAGASAGQRDVDRGADGASTHANASGAIDTRTYNSASRHAEDARPPTTTRQQVRRSDAGLSSVAMSGVAAKGGPSVLARIKNWSGSEYKSGPNLRIAPFGNRTGHPTGRYPHYHRRVVYDAGETLPGQGIGRHRPWDTKSPDTSFWDRF
jgi:hypothetical protein